MTDPRRLLVLGAGGHGRAVADVAVAAGRTVVGFTEPGGARLGDPPVLGRDDELAVLAKRHDAFAVVGVGNTALARRAELFTALAAACRPAPALVHPRATVAPPPRSLWAPLCSPTRSSAPASPSAKTP